MIQMKHLKKGRRPNSRLTWTLTVTRIQLEEGDRQRKSQLSTIVVLILTLKILPHLNQKKIITSPIARRRSSSLNNSNSSVSTKSTNGEEDEFSHDVRTTSRQPISSFSTSLTPRSINTVRASTNNTPAENSTLSRNCPRDEVGQDVRFTEKGQY